MAKQKDKFKTMHSVFDEFTNRNIYKLISEGHFDGLESPISVGKEANIFSAKKGDSRLIVKIYRLETCDFNRMYDYIKHDIRFHTLKNKRREVIFSWVQREYRNLLKARELGVKVPIPIRFINNILVMEFIGEKDPAPKLKDLIPKNKKKFSDCILDYVMKMQKGGLVHADLSSFNILNLREKPVFIDFSQCTTFDDPRAYEFLERDLKNVVQFFRKYNLNLNMEKIKKLFKLK